MRTNDTAVLLIHGLGGSEYDLGTLGKKLARAGMQVYALTLPGHGTQPEDLNDVLAEEWLDAARRQYRIAAAAHQQVHVIGMCMGALLAVETVKRERHRQGRLIALAPPVFIDGWATPWYRAARYWVYRLPLLGGRIRVAEEDPYGIKNERIRALIKARFERGDKFHYSWVPLACIRQVDRLRGWVMKDLDQIDCPTLVLHAREDELTSLRSAHYLVDGIGGGPKHGGLARMVVLENSFHMICVDNDRELVAQQVLQFLGAEGSAAGEALSPPATPALQRPSVPVATMEARVTSAMHSLASGDFAALYDAGGPDFCWVQPGRNQRSGRYLGTAGRERLLSWANGLRFEAQGPASFNASMALQPAVLHDGRGWTSSGALVFTMTEDRLSEARWFPADGAADDAYFKALPDAA